MILTSNANAQALSEVEKGYAIGAGFSAAQAIKMTKFQKYTKDDAVKECEIELSKNALSVKSVEHFSVAKNKCVEDLTR